MSNGSQALADIEDRFEQLLLDSKDASRLVSTVLGFMLPVAFGMVRAGSVPAGGVMCVMFQQLVDLSVGVMVWVCLGYGQASGTSGRFVALSSQGVFAYDIGGGYTLCTMLVGVSLFSSTVSCRLRVPHYALVVTVCTAFPYPTALHWAWSPEGWLSPVSRNRLLSGICDANGMLTALAFAGGMSIAASLIVGPRMPRELGSNATQLLLSGHNRFYQSCGTVFLSTVFFVIVSSGMDPWASAHAAIGVVLSMSTSVIVGGTLSYEVHGFFDLRHTLNAVVCGLASASTSAPYVPLACVPLITSVSIASYYFLYYKGTHIYYDDPCLVLTTYVLPGVWGALGTGLFAAADILGHSYPAMQSHGLLSGGGGALLLVQVVGVVCIVIWGMLWVAAVLLALRVSTSLHVLDPGNGDWDTQEHGSRFCDYVRDYITLPEAAGIPEDALATVLFKLGGTLSRRGTLRVSALFVFVSALALVEGTAGQATPSSDLSQVDDLANRTAALEVGLARMSLDADITWKLLCGIIVFGMQLGFCFLEAGCVRSGSVISIVFKNIADTAIGGLFWWLFGYSIAYGGGSPFMGTTSDRVAFSPNTDDNLSTSIGHFFLSYTYMMTAATIISGAVAERISLEAYGCFVCVLSVFAYPVVVHWVWSDSGWLSPWSPNNIASNGVLDFSGSIIIHLFGGTCALTLAYLIGPRRLQGGVSVFSPEGRVVVAPHNRFLLTVGTLLLWMAWFAFNCGSVVRISGGGSKVAGNSLLCTMLASSSSAAVGMVVTRIYCGYFELSHCCNCVLVGLVSITASCAYVAPEYAHIIGFVSVGFYFGAMRLILWLRVDDVVGAVSVHLGGGIWGGLAVGLFADAERIRQATRNTALGTDYGLFMGGGGRQLAIQVVGILVTMSWGVLISATTYYTMRLVMDVRMSEAAELSGIDITKHRAHSYDYIERLEIERLRALESVVLVQTIAESLVCFDLDSAREALVRADCQKNEELLSAFRSLIDNLQAYRPYLPDSLFDIHDASGVPPSPPSVSVPGELVSMVFTDIQQSTASWEACPEGMNKGLKIHNKVMREAIHRHRGYEVKIIGDAFMVAFSSVVDSCSFALAAHVGLYKARWPEDLLQVPACSVSKEECLCGPRVRIGVHYGEVTRECNSITGRFDYFGPTVNRAARVESACIGGTVAVTDTVLEYLTMADGSLPDSNFECLGAPVVLSMGEVDLKGVGSTGLYAMIPRELERRRDYVELCIRLNVRRTPDMQDVERSSLSFSRDNPTEIMSVDTEPLRLERCPSCSIASVDVTQAASLEESSQHISEDLCWIISCADRTEGTIFGLLSSSVLIGWNTTKRTRSYFESSLRYVSLVHESFRRPEHAAKALSVGLSIGTTLVGNIGTHAQRFISTLGPCVPLASTLSGASRALGVTCLFATPVPEEGTRYLDALRPFCRPVDRWKLQGTVGTTPWQTTVYEVHSRRLRECPLARLGLADVGPELAAWEWSQFYWDAFAEGDYGLMESGAAADKVLYRVAKMLENGTSLQNLVTVGNS